MSECLTEVELMKMAWEQAFNHERVVAAPQPAPLPPPPAVTLPPPPPKSRWTLQSTAHHIPSDAIKALRAQFTPLAAQELPEPQDLAAFWSSVERAIESLDPSFVDF